jgi:hypothetical protein
MVARQILLLCGTEQKLVCAKDSGEIALVPNLYGTCVSSLAYMVETEKSTKRVAQHLQLVDRYLYYKLNITLN